MIQGIRIGDNLIDKLLGDAVFSLCHPANFPSTTLEKKTEISRKILSGSGCRLSYFVSKSEPDPDRNFREASAFFSLPGTKILRGDTSNLFPYTSIHFIPRQTQRSPQLRKNILQRILRQTIISIS